MRKVWRTAESLPHLALPVLSSQQQNAMVKHGGSDCGLVEAVSVSGRGDALISPVRVKDTGTCKADPGFVLHCLCFQSDCYNLDLKREKEERGKSKGKHKR